MRRRPAHGVEDCAADQQIEVGPFGTERVISWRFLDLATLPPAMLADDDARIEICVEGSFCPDTSFLGRDQNPISRRNPARLGCFRVQRHAGHYEHELSYSLGLQPEHVSADAPPAP